MLGLLLLLHVLAADADGARDEGELRQLLEHRVALQRELPRWEQHLPRRSKVRR